MDGDQANGGFVAAGLAQIPPALQAVVDAGDLSGFVTLIWRKGEVAQVNTIGHRDVEAGLPMTRDTLFRIASMTKPVTSIAALMLWEEGKLKLDDPITKWLPEFADMRVLKDAAGPVDDTSPAPRAITVEDLMTHRSGLAYAFTSVGPIGEAYEKALGPPLAGHLAPDDWLARLGSLPLSYAPGERFHYSHATEVLGFLVARIEGKPLGQVLKDRIFAPLGMADTDFWCPPEKRDRMAKLYRIDPQTDRLQDVSFPHVDSQPAFEAGGGGLISTADDYLKFARMMLGQGEVDGVRLVKTSTLETMTQNRLTEAQRQIPFMGIPFWLGQGFGLGVSTITDPEKQAWMGAGSKGAFGWPGAFGTWWQADPAQDMVVIYLIQNSMPLGPELAAQLATGQRMGGRAALPVFQKMVYGALGK
ncbi:MAG TPA: serine hydrolase domain-containing protein [Phenylobacterium sp.]|jgi:CubicO group peptidase (beta-lactamase class C family)|uniref:serine hydrolase domain-containing protein n=1 Tax=Phenylobacterium sp. TaxID=1871053 RepID=UPI002CC36931|nr:serine hydrolase domain-containing protein [Phenylobacterium sp.]HXA37542.1 serine hydrolase domain-containing protein [Phenylobacterium sp.]